MAEQRQDQRSNTIKVALYARVSLDESADDKRYQEPENQLQPLRDWAKSQGWTIIEEYVDKASGADASRKFFRLMMAHASQRRFNAVLVWKMDRFSRENMSVVIGHVQKLKSRGVGLKSLTESFLDTASDNPMGEVVLAVMSWAASEERRKISERTKAGIRQLRAIGRWKGGRPRKYCRECKAKMEYCYCLRGGGETPDDNSA